jgi:predicted dienelactone hydrolase
MRLPIRRILLLTLLVILVATACGKDKKRKEAEPEPEPTKGPYAVGTRTLHFVDESRPLAFDNPDGPRRKLDTNIWYPAKGAPSEGEVPDAPAADGPFPLIVFNHGRAGEPQQYAASFRAWARAGYVVAGVRHPLTVRGLPFPGVTEDIVNEPADVSFVITQLGKDESDLVDLDHVAVAGHSSGAIVALANGFNTCCYDDRVDAVLLESVLAAPFPDGQYFTGLPNTPVLFFHGDADVSFPYNIGRGVFDEVKSPKFFVTIKGGSHSDPYRDGPPDYRLVADASLDFFDRYLKEEKDALTRLESDVAKYPFGQLEAVPD